MFFSPWYDCDNEHIWVSEISPVSLKFCLKGDSLERRSMAWETVNLRKPLDQGSNTGGEKENGRIFREPLGYGAWEGMLMLRSCSMHRIPKQLGRLFLVLQWNLFSSSLDFVRNRASNEGNYLCRECWAIVTIVKGYRQWCHFIRSKTCLR